MEGFQSIPLDQIVESKTNPRSAPTPASLADLVASIKEKGVLVPIIVRRAQGSPTLEELTNGKIKGADPLYELVAGSRRLAAAKSAGLKEIPSSIRDLNDTGAREVQIVENLQREDVHPLDEAYAYKGLINTAHDIKAVAARVGKSEAYVRARLNLVQLSKEAAAAFRDGNINAGHAGLIAGLSPNGDQQKATKHAKDRQPDTQDFKHWIGREFGDPLSNQPWLKDAAIAVAAGTCKLCPPNHDTLFGSVSDGQCTTLKCWDRKMKNLIAHLQKKNPGAVLIRDEYWTGSGGTFLGRDRYAEVTKAKPCKHGVVGIFGEGEQRGTTLQVCIAKSCTTHRGSSAKVPLTPAEREKRQKEKEKEAKAIETEKAKTDKERTTALSKVDWPPRPQDLDALFEANQHGIEEMRTILIRHGVKVEKKMYDGTEEKQIRKLFEERDPIDRLRLILELAIEHDVYMSGGDVQKCLLKKS